MKKYGEKQTPQVKLKGEKMCLRMWRNADPSSKEMREENKNPHVKEYGEQQTQRDLTCEECRKPVTMF